MFFQTKKWLSTWSLLLNFFMRRVQYRRDMQRCKELHMKGCPPVTWAPFAGCPPTPTPPRLRPPCPSPHPRGASPRPPPGCPPPTSPPPSILPLSEGTEGSLSSRLLEPQVQYIDDIEEGFRRGRICTSSFTLIKRKIEFSLIYKEIQTGAVAKSYTTNGLLKYD